MRAHVLLFAVVLLAGCSKTAEQPAPLPTGEAWVESVNAWRAKHETDYRRDWVTIAGLHFLEPGTYSIGSAQASDIKLPEGVTLVALAHGDDQPLVAVNPPREEEVEIPVETAAAPGEVPATAQAEPGAEGEAAAGDSKDKDAKSGGGGKAKGGKD